MDEWRPVIINGYSTNYEVTKNGIIRHTITKHVKSTHLNKDGYEMVNIYYNHGWSLIGVHRIVAYAFIPNPNNLSEVNHIDGIKHHNSMYNLEWVDRLYNMQHAYKTGLNKNEFGFNARHNIYPKSAIISVIEALKTDASNMSKISRQTGVPVDTIFLIKVGRRYQDIAKELNFTPIQPQPRFDFSPYHNAVKQMVLDGYSNKDIRTTIKIPINDMTYNYYIRKIRKEINCKRFND